MSPGLVRLREGRREGQGKLLCHFGSGFLKAGSRPGPHLTEDHWEPELFQNRSCAAAPSLGESGKDWVRTAALDGSCWKLSALLLLLRDGWTEL